jgi:hypothetical protein
MNGSTSDFDVQYRGTLSRMSDEEARPVRFCLFVGLCGRFGAH